MLLSPDFLRNFQRFTELNMNFLLSWRRSKTDKAGHTIVFDPLSGSDALEGLKCLP